MPASLSWAVRRRKTLQKLADLPLLLSSTENPQSIFEPPHQHMTYAEFLSHSLEQRWPLAVALIDDTQASPSPEVKACLARLTQLQAVKTFAVPHKNQLKRLLPFFLALGFRRSNLPNGHPVYEFSLYDYQLPKQWLNARFWANPEQWNKHRW